MAIGWESSLTFLVAVVLLTAAHLLRVIRWRSILRRTHIEVTNLPPLAALSLGYAVNAFLPFRVGELVRALFLAQTARASLMSVLAGIAFERSLDLLAVAAIAAAYLALREPAISAGMVVLPLAAFVVVLVSGIGVERSAAWRRILWGVAALFNDGIKTAALHFAQVFGDFWSWKGGLRNLPFWELTVTMWVAYTLSLYFFAVAVHEQLAGVFATIYYAPLYTSLIPSIIAGSGSTLLLGLYLICPVVLVGLYFAGSGAGRTGRFRRVVNWATAIETLTTDPAPFRAGKFRAAENYGAFLDRKFSGRGGMLADFEERAIGDGVLHRIFPGGSGAITALIEQEGRLLVRKYASGEVARKLGVQRAWMEAHKTELPVVQLLGKRCSPDEQLYDMAYIGGTRDLYEAVHSEPTPASAAILGNVIDRLDGFHRTHAQDPASAETVRAYVTNKACANLALVEKAFPAIFEQQSIELNGTAFAMQSLGVLRSNGWLAARFSQRGQAVIHGDLTIENIMILPQARQEDWFLIDPNPENGFESPLIDFAKLIQSLHLGYESVHRDPRSSFMDGRLSVSIHRSAQYDYLFGFAVERLTEKFGERGVREILLHEVVNYLRLIPYQLRRSPAAGMTFLACLCLLLRDYDRRYPGDLGC